MFRIDMLPAAYGDCLWIEYGPRAAPRRVLIDGGTRGTFKTLKKRLAALPADRRHFELLVITHVDADHVGGAVALLEASAALNVTFGDVWFNGWKHLSRHSGDVLGPVDGERVTQQLTRQGANWNKAFRRGAVVVRDRGAPPATRLPGGLAITLLSPTWTELERLRPVWEATVRAAGLVPGQPPTPARTGRRERGDDLLGGGIDVDALNGRRFVTDTAEANGSSIAFLAEFRGVRCLFGADAHPHVLTASLARLKGGRRRTLAAVKLPHHGSRHNVSPDLLDRVKSRHVLISTNGVRFRHPDQEAIARTIRQLRGARLHFNYRSAFTDVWDDATLMRRHGYSARYATTDEGLRIEL